MGGEPFRPRTAVVASPSDLRRAIATTDDSAFAIASAIVVSSAVTTSIGAGGVDAGGGSGQPRSRQTRGVRFAINGFLTALADRLPGCLRPPARAPGDSIYHLF